MCPRVLFLRLLTGAAVSCVALAATASQPPDLLSPLAESANAHAASDPVHAALLADRTVAAPLRVRAQATAVEAQTDALRIALPDAPPLLVRQQYAYRNDDGSLVWAGISAGYAGRHPGDPQAHPAQDSVLIVRNGERLTASLRSGGRLYRLVPLRDGQHAIARIDERRMPPEHPADYQTRAITLLQPGTVTQDAEPADKATTVVRVGVLVTRAAANAIGDLTGFAQLAVAESNRGFANSGVAVSLKLAGVRTTGYRSVGFGTDLFRFASPSDGQLDGWHGIRNSLRADVSVLIVNNASACGIGYINANAHTAFSVVHHGCATGYYSFGHEIGHNFGAHHNPQAPAQNAYYPYGHGYLGPGRTWRTIMAYDCSGGCPRINRWSTPNRRYGGAATGTAGTHNNARVLNQRRATIAGFR